MLIYDGLETRNNTIPKQTLQFLILFIELFDLLRSFDGFLLFGLPFRNISV